MLRSWGSHCLLVAATAALVGVAGAQSFIPDLTFGAPCHVVRERVLARDKVSPLQESDCGGMLLPELELKGDFSGFKASHFDGSEMFILYFYFENDRFVAVMVGTTMGVETLNALAEYAYGPFNECFEIIDSGAPAITCVGVVEDAIVSWTRSDVHASLTFYDLARFDSEPGESDPAPTSAATDVYEGFQLISFDARWEGDRLLVVGEVRNVSGRAAGVELQVTARDSSGRLVDVATFWPASINNIRPGASYGFRHTVTRQRTATSVDVQIVGTQVW